MLRARSWRRGARGVAEGGDPVIHEEGSFALRGRALAPGLAEPDRLASRKSRHGGLDPRHSHRWAHDLGADGAEQQKSRARRTGPAVRQPRRAVSLTPPGP